MIRTALVTLFTAAMLVGPGPLVPPAAHAYRFGAGPIDDVYAQADRERQNVSCSISRYGLSALTVSASIAETVGGSSTRTPSPMTLGRGDYFGSGFRAANRHFYESSNPSTPYPRAFWHAGLGLYQLDPAGMGAEVAAAQSISSWTSSGVAARRAAQRYCAANGSDGQRRAYAWGEWYACANGRCEKIFQAIYRGTSTPLALTRDSAVQRFGGMIQRRCFHTTTPGQPRFDCWLINPSNAQGDRGWAGAPLSGSTSASPLTTPFYGYRHGQNGQEYRHWFSADSPYLQTIYARRAWGRDPRQGHIVWTRAAVLCDATTWRGNCSGGPQATR